MTDVALEYVIIGNDVIFKCKIPSFAFDFVTIKSWSFKNHENNHGSYNEITSNLHEGN